MPTSQELVHPHPRWQRPGRWPPSRRCKSGSGGWGHTHHPPTRAVFYALLFTPSPLFSAHAASQQAATRLFDGLLALHSHSHGREGLRAGARLLSLQTPEEQARQSQSPAPPSSPSSFQTVQTALSTTAMKPVKQAAETSGRGAPGQAVVALVLEGRAASLAVTAVPAAMTEEGVEVRFVRRCMYVIQAEGRRGLIMESEHDRS